MSVKRPGDWKIIWIRPVLKEKIFALKEELADRTHRTIIYGDALRFLFKMRDEYFASLTKEEINTKLEGV